MFCFWDKCIWFVCIHLSLVIREYLSQAVTVLRKGLKNFHVSKSDFCNSITFTVITQDDKGALIKIESAFCPVYHVACQEVLSNESFETFIWGRLSWSVISEIHKFWGSYFFWKYSKLSADSKNVKIDWDKMLCFWDKCIWIVSIHLSLLIREHLSSAVNVLRKGVKNFHVCKSDFCKSITFTVITQDDKGALIKIELVFQPVYHVACRGVLSNGSV